MKKYLLNTLILIFIATFSVAQTATDFTVDDCNGTSFNLYSELDAGKVIVLCWVMPCGPCATGAGYAQDAAQSFASSHPGIVKFYLADDFANSDCSYLNAWAGNYQLFPEASFSNSLISMNDYGGPGMPKVVVIGPDKQVYYNVNNNQITEAGVVDGINQALSGTVSISDNPIDNISFNYLYTYNKIELKHSISTPISINIFNNLGELVKIDHIEDLNSITIDVKDLNKGLYILKINSGKKRSTFRFIR